jgi:hypothetical protein
MEYCFKCIANIKLQMKTNFQRQMWVTFVPNKFITDKFVKMTALDYE